MKCINYKLLFKTYTNKYVLCTDNQYLILYDCENDTISATNISPNPDARYYYSEKLHIITECFPCETCTMIKTYSFDTSEKLNEMLLDKAIFMCFDTDEDYLVCVNESAEFGFGVFLLDYHSLEITRSFYCDDYLIENVATCSKQTLCFVVAKPKSSQSYLFKMDIPSGKHHFIDLSQSKTKYISELLYVNPVTNLGIGVTEKRLFKKYRICVFNTESFERLTEYPFGFHSRLRICLNDYIRWLDDNLFVFETNKMYKIYDVSNKSIIEKISKKSGYFPTLSRCINNSKIIYGFR